MLASGADATTDNGSVNVVQLPDGSLLAMSGEGLGWRVRVWPPLTA